MNRERDIRPESPNLSVDKLLDFFLGLRKGEITRRVEALRQRHPDETPDQLARRVVSAQRPPSLLGGVLFELPMLLPAVGPGLKLLGVAGSASTLVRMHMAMILEVALIHGFDIDDRARLVEMTAVLAATGMASSAPVIGRSRGLRMPQTLVVGTFSVMTASEPIGQSAIAYYGGRMPRSQSPPAKRSAGNAFSVA